MASSLWYFSKTPTFKLHGANRYDFFDTLPGSHPQGDHFYMLIREGFHLPDWLAQEHWHGEVVEKIPPRYEILEFKK
jgi:hypothetical protein